ncbi:putative membrane transporter protein PD_1894 [Candidatus Hydrogenisulfobacillus filiaventi]|uniref:Probable membrane transporter protein n=1 Tax=Candidatus Hydrogenisulfobacillus filiaventi TaxID=2707344 RepID=A0A6F8ZG85_9FIRM|nr:sulfite exporter TauE/SafE family protein [Bacillota bacterium]CAB1128790.1 putative membrane transporter protein PD_1894 [Candidatus Hydrogenisulfobacillus filiaventi]
MHETALQAVLAIFAGSLVGFSLGLIGGGGSILAVPLLLYLVGLHDPHLVIGTTALAVSFNAFFNLLPHWRAGHVRWCAAIAFSIPGIIGSYLGSTLGKAINGKALLFLFAILMLVVAFNMVRNRRVTGSGGFGWRPSMLRRIIPAGLGVGLLSGFFGIGGGFLIVPGLVFSTGMSMINAIGTSLFSVGAFGLTTALNYAASGLVDWLVVVEYIAGGMAGGVLGAMLATRLSHRKEALQYIFAAVVVAVAIYMLYKNLAVLHL